MSICFTCKKELEVKREVEKQGVSYWYCLECYVKREVEETNKEEPPDPKKLAGQILPSKGQSTMLIEAIQATFKQYHVDDFLFAFQSQSDQPGQGRVTSISKRGDFAWIDGALHLLKDANDLNINKVAREMMGMR